MGKSIKQILGASHSWIDFKSALAGLNAKTKGDCFERLVLHYLQIHPTYATALKKVWMLSEVPPSIRKKLSLPDIDEGIDLVAQTKAGDFWAIQCKYREDESKSLTRKDVP